MRWPWQRKPRANFAPKHWPKKVYFLDGPYAGQTHNDIMPCRDLAYLEIAKHRENVWDGLAYLMVSRPTTYASRIYVWDTVYPNGDVAYMRLA